MPDLHCVAVPANADRLPALRQALTRWATSVGMLTERVQALTLAVYEAMANVVTHAYRGAPDAGVFDLHAVCDSDDQHVTVTVTDFGRWQLEVVDDRDDRLRPGGRGLLLIRAMSDDAAIDTDVHGTTVRMNWLVA